MSAVSKRHTHHWYYYVGLVLLVLVLLAAAFVGWLTLSEFRPDDLQDADRSRTVSDTVRRDEPLHLLTFNTGYAGLGAEADFLMDGGKTSNPASEDLVEKNMDGIETILQRSGADILLLQETDRDASRSWHHDQWTRYADALPGYEACFAPNYVCPFVPYPVSDPIGAVNSGIATYSRFHMDSAVRESLPVPFQWPIRVANLKRCLLVSRLPIADSDKELVIVNLHLEAYDDGEGKIAQTQQLLSLLQEEYDRGNYIIAGGDFNQVFPKAKHEVKETSAWVPGRLDELPGDWDYLFDDSTPTCRLLNQPLEPQNELTQFYTIDGFIVSPNVHVEQVQTQSQDFQYSDHNPVALTVRLQ